MEHRVVDNIGDLAYFGIAVMKKPLTERVANLVFIDLTQTIQTHHHFS